jgi:hypothetical protein
MAQKTMKSLVLVALSWAILLAISVSAVKLWKACEEAIGASTATYSVPVLFFLFAVAAHFAGKMLPPSARRRALVCTYFFKIVTSVTLSLTANAAMICGSATVSAGAASCAGIPEMGQFSAALLALAGHHPPQVVVPVLIYLFFVILGDVLALALEFLHASVDDDGAP